MHDEKLNSVVQRKQELRDLIIKSKQRSSPESLMMQRKQNYYMYMKRDMEQLE